MGWAYYNENNEFACAFLAELMQAGVIADGVIDGRSITDVQPEDLDGFTQHHFFAGLGGWSYALRLAGVPDDRPVWTGSCPCQPFSVAGKQKGEADERHLWPEFRRLIAVRRPSIVLGEQVASKAGRVWLAGVRADMEALGYAVGAADLCAAGFGAPHIRQRLNWVAYGQCDSGDTRRLTSQPGEGDGAAPARPRLESGRRGDTGERLEYDASNGRQQRRAEPGERSISSGRGEVRGLADSAGDRAGHNESEQVRRAAAITVAHSADGSGLADSASDRTEGNVGSEGRTRCTSGSQLGGCSADGGLADSQGTELSYVGSVASGQQDRPSDGGRMGDSDDAGFQGRSEHAGEYADQCTPWSASLFIPCLDDKWRRIPINEAGEPEPSLFPLAHGFPNRVGILRCSGNAIVPWQSAEFILACEEAYEIFRALT